jgi:zona occludens toxin
MIELITGLPGNAKTLYTIGEVKRRAEAEGRPVYYAGIKELQLDWTPIEADKWTDCPAGSIIVIDECQKVFRNRSLGAQPPAHVTEL